MNVTYNGFESKHREQILEKEDSSGIFFFFCSNQVLLCIHEPKMSPILRKNTMETTYRLGICLVETIGSHVSCRRKKN